MTGIGKYVRHGAAWTGAVAAAWVVGLVEPLGVILTEADAALLEGGFTVLGFLVAGIGYAFLEKWLKRFPQIDLEGWTDRARTYQEAVEAEAEQPSVQARRVPR